MLLLLQSYVQQHIAFKPAEQGLTETTAVSESDELKPCGGSVVNATCYKTPNSQKCTTGIPGPFFFPMNMPIGPPPGRPNPGPCWVVDESFCCAFCFLLCCSLIDSPPCHHHAADPPEQVRLSQKGQSPLHPLGTDVFADTPCDQEHRGLARHCGQGFPETRFRG